jgi:CPA1 family monovalent cation:H+ antiporter
MRGTVTLAAALALPTNFPFRDLILTTAFGVTLGTLVIQGLTLRPLIKRLRLEDDGSVEREIRRARVETLHAALTAAAECPQAETGALVRHRYELQLRRAEQELANDGARSNGVAAAGSDADGGAAETNGVDADAAVVRAETDAQRKRLVALRADGTIGDAAFQRFEEELDWAELDWSRLVRAGEP